jgi:hypothetical protein
LLAEGYMLKFEPGGPLSPREIEHFMDDLVGPRIASQPGGTPSLIGRNPLGCSHPFETSGSTS